jgi:hypothetical protein
VRGVIAAAVVLVAMGVVGALSAGQISLCDSCQPATYSAFPSELAGLDKKVADDEAPIPRPWQVLSKDAVPLPSLSPAGNIAGAPRPLTRVLVSAGLAIEVKRPTAELMTRLTPVEEAILPEPLATSIFHPPRAIPVHC